MTDVAVIGAGLGGLAAAVSLAAAGRSVEVFEASERPGGKADEVILDGVACDTGPTLLTLPHVAETLFSLGGTALRDEVSLLQHAPATRYRFADGLSLDVHHQLEDTLSSVERALGAEAASQLGRHLERARRIWEASADPFVFGAAPSLRGVLALGPRAWWSLGRIDAHRTLAQVIRADVEDPHLRDLLMRYATYNGSDPRRAPGTLACIAWVELGLGGWGVEGGVHALATALARVAERLGVVLHLGEPVEAIALSDDVVTGLTVGGRQVRARAVVANADVAHVHRLLPARGRGGVRPQGTLSTSGWVGILRVGPGERVAHEVVFPAEYGQEFADLFDRCRPPADPAVYTCALSRAHGRGRWGDGEPLFAMVNAPAGTPAGHQLAEVALGKLVAAGLVGEGDELLWERDPAGLAQRFPDTHGALYGAASSDLMAAFRRPANRVRGLRGLYLAGGSAHPGGGVPLVLQSGMQAAAELLAESR